MTECKHHKGYACPVQDVYHAPSNRLPKPKQRQRSEWRVARMLSAILDEPYDDVNNPDPVRIEQARRLLSC